MRMRTSRFRRLVYIIKLNVHVYIYYGYKNHALKSTETTTAMTVKVIIKESPAAAQVDRPAFGTARKKRQA